MREPVSLKDKIRQVLTETRVILPGAQALLGFACITTLMDGFASLPPWLKTIHLASLVAVAVSIVLLMTPAAVHRIAEQGEATTRFHRLASCLVVAALVPLGLSLAGELFVLVYKVTGLPELAVAISIMTAICFTVLWFILPAMLKNDRSL